MAYLEAGAEKILLDALGTTANAVNWTIEAIAELPVGGREYGYDPLVPYGVEPAQKILLDALGTTANAVNWTIEAIAELSKLAPKRYYWMRWGPRRMP
jgi:hypothetical protein